MGYASKALWNMDSLGVILLPHSMRGRNIMPAKKHTVKFVATKMVKEPTDVTFKTKAGKRVEFEAEKPVKEKVKVQFQAKDK